VKFSYNNTLSGSTDVSPFFANKRYHPKMFVHPKHNIAFSQASSFAINLNKSQNSLKAEITTG